MAEQDDGEEKTLDPTPQRLQRARDQGDVPKSQDLSVAAAYLGLLLSLAISAEHIGFNIGAPLVSFLGAPEILAEELLGPGGPALALEFATRIGAAAAPLILVPALFVLLSLLVQRAVVFAPTKIEPKLSRLNPIQNAKQKFGPTGLVEFLKSFTKLFAIAILLVVIFINNHDDVAHLMQLDARALPGLLMNEAMLLLTATLAIVSVIAAMDVLWQQHQHIQKLKMSHTEMKDEMKNTEGDPKMKSARRQRARDIATNQMLQDVPGATVVVVNPTHYAVALTWDRSPGAAPRCVAKGVDEIAAKIREIAEENDVPIHSDPPTARLLFATLEVGDEILFEHYQAVAVAIRFADSARKTAEKAGWRRSDA